MPRPFCVYHSWFSSQSPHEYHIIGVIDKPVCNGCEMFVNLVALISMVRHSPCEDHWNAKMTSLATNRAAIFVTSLEMSMNTI